MSDSGLPPASNMKKATVAKKSGQAIARKPSNDERVSCFSAAATPPPAAAGFWSRAFQRGVPAALHLHVAQQGVADPGVQNADEQLRPDEAGDVAERRPAGELARGFD